jgi:hypothetical protein
LACSRPPSSAEFPDRRSQDASAIGSLLIPWLKKLGYPAPFAAGTIAAAATIDILIPPSIPMIIYALVSGASIGALFIAGILPGLLMCAGFMAVCYVQGRRRNFPRITSPFKWGRFITEVGYALPALALPVLIIIFLRFGIATPTEVSVMSTLYAFVVSLLVYRDLTLVRLKAAVTEAGIATGVVLLIIMASSVVGWIVTYEQLPAAFVDFAQSTLREPWLIILAMNIIMLATGMFIDLPAGGVAADTDVRATGSRRWNEPCPAGHHDDRQSVDRAVSPTSGDHAFHCKLYRQGANGRCRDGIDSILCRCHRAADYDELHASAYDLLTMDNGKYAP